MKRFTAVAMMSIALLLITSMAFGQVSSFPYSYVFDSGAQDPITGDGNWSSQAIGSGPTWVQLTGNGVSGGAAALPGYTGSGNGSRLRVRLNTSGRTFNGSETWTFSVRRTGNGTNNGRSNTTIKIQYSTDGTNWTDIESTLGQANYLSNTNYTTKTVTLPAAMENLSSVYLAFTVSGGHNTGANDSMYVDNSTISGGALPVQMVSFTASANRLDANLRWSTATETNNYGFEIERRSLTKPEQNWNTIAFVRGGGTSTSRQEYSYVDAGLAPGRYAYRIKQIDNDGSFTYAASTEVEVGVAAKVFALEPNYPNPFNPSTRIEFTVPEDGFATLKVYNLLGQEVAVLFSGVARAGQVNQLTFDATQLPTGMYFSRLEYGNQSIVRKMLFTK
jgi:hypothetical protein